jgi:class 3 adenylate cyclase
MVQSLKVRRRDDVSLKDELNTYVQNVLDEQWQRRTGRKVPEPEDLSLKNLAVELEATVLYADLAGSTKMVRVEKDWFATEVYKSYLYCASRLIRSEGGSITAYDGDRVMGVFIGDSKNTSAASCALKINHAVKKIILSKIEAKYPSKDFSFNQRVGIDMSKLFIARTGIRGTNDLVWVGNAANNAAKMAALSPEYASYITADVYESLNRSAKLDVATECNMWTDLGKYDLGYRIFGSNWMRSI